MNAKPSLGDTEKASHEPDGKSCKCGSCASVSKPPVLSLKPADPIQANLSQFKQIQANSSSEKKPPLVIIQIAPSASSFHLHSAFIT